MVSIASVEKCTVSLLKDWLAASLLGIGDFRELFCTEVSADFSRTVCKHVEALRARVERSLVECDKMKRARYARSQSSRSNKGSSTSERSI